MRRLLVLAALMPCCALAADAGTGLDVSHLRWSREAIQQVIASHAGEIRHCYEQTMAETEKSLTGTVKTYFEIAPGGGVKHARVLRHGTTMRNHDLQSCVIEVVNGFEFPRPPDHKTHPIEYPFHFKPIR